MRATQKLPCSYRRQSTLDLSSNRALLIAVNLLGTALFFTPSNFWIQGVYAFAAAPKWYILRNQHLVITLAPLVLITGAGLHCCWLCR
ncbi:hypothetical protein [Pseudanabaena sp. FACHB-2040]|uniref:hypothetical protein n=1 Tax=Pseudanabaena sp. FACHB-2040 TaxID=2692859 RepID=UPI001689B5CA|nr:hypothetical protein [Pseudanabaena sp. FACHB-2040]MBD2257723.1 hypothetical protein [Pseudanabaena sp. FACHB-2040]